MLADEDLFRKPPPRPYRPTAARLSLPHDALVATLASLHRAGSLESSVFWYGIRQGEEAVVAAVLTPQQRMTRGNYHVGPAAMSEMVCRLKDDWKPLAQIHSHPGSGVEHSTYDDRMASSRRALSIVFPFYGQWTGPWPVGVGVHEWQDDYWHLLTEDLAARRVLISGHGSVLVLDFRR